jgi:hypothetical protein
MHHAQAARGAREVEGLVRPRNRHHARAVWRPGGLTPGGLACVWVCGGVYVCAQRQNVTEV